MPAPGLAWDRAKQRLFSPSVVTAKGDKFPSRLVWATRSPQKLFSGTEPRFNIPLTKIMAILLNIVPCLAPGSAGTSSTPLQPNGEGQGTKGSDDTETVCGQEHNTREGK